MPEGTKPTDKEMSSARAVIERRLDSKGIFDRNITVENESGRIVVEYPTSREKQT